MVAKQGKVKRTTFRYVYEPKFDLVRFETESANKYDIQGYLNAHEVEASWSFHAKGGEQLVDMTDDEIKDSNNKAYQWNNENLNHWSR